MERAKMGRRTPRRQWRETGSNFFVFFSFCLVFLPPFFRSRVKVGRLGRELDGLVAQKEVQGLDADRGLRVRNADRGQEAAIGEAGGGGGTVGEEPPARVQGQV